MTIRIAGLALLAALLAVPAAAFADDLMPPPFRGEPNSVFVHYNRATPTGPLELVEQSMGPGGDPLYTGDPDGPGGPIQPGGNAQIVGMMQFTQPDGQKWDIYVPNKVDNEPVKLVQVQITYSYPDTHPGGIGSVAILNADPFVDGFMDLVDVQDISPPTGNTVVIYEKWYGEIYPNPDWEIFQINVPGQLDQVVIDTISLPEPTSAVFAAAGAGLVTLIRRRR